MMDNLLVIAMLTEFFCESFRWSGVLRNNGCKPRFGASEQHPMIILHTSVSISDESLSGVLGSSSSVGPRPRSDNWSNNEASLNKPNALFIQKFLFTKSYAE